MLFRIETANGPVVVRAEHVLFLEAASYGTNLWFAGEENFIQTTEPAETVLARWRQALLTRTSEVVT